LFFIKEVGNKGGCNNTAKDYWPGPVSERVSEWVLSRV